jgi:hypothetical protein
LPFVAVAVDVAAAVGVDVDVVEVAMIANLFSRIFLM